MQSHTQQAIRRAHSVIKRQRLGAAAHTRRGNRQRRGTRGGRAPWHARDSKLSHAAVHLGRTKSCATLRTSICARMFESRRVKRVDLRTLHYGKSEDPAKMAYSRMALIRRGLGAKPANSNSHARVRRAGCRSASAQASSAAAVRARQRTPCDQAVEDEELGEEGRHRTLGARTRAVRIQA